MLSFDGWKGMLPVCCGVLSPWGQASRLCCDCDDLVATGRLAQELTPAALLKAWNAKQQRAG